MEEPDFEKIDEWIGSLVGNHDPDELAGAFATLVGQWAAWCAVAKERAETIKTLKDLVEWREIEEARP